MTEPPDPAAAPTAPPPPALAKSGHGWLRSLRFRLLLATLLALLVALLLAGVLLAGLFRDHVLRQFQAALTAQLDQVTARLEFDTAGQPQVDSQTLTDPRWSRPLSGQYWQVDRVATGTPRIGVLRSRSLWDAELTVQADALADGVVHVHEAAGPGGARLLLVERTVRRRDSNDAADTSAGTAWRLLVAGDLRDTQDAVARFNGVLAASLSGLLGLLCLAAVAQVAVGLSPLRAVQRALAAVRDGAQHRLSGSFPAELQPLVDDFNAVLDRNAEIVARARTQAGNLAHGIKTPLAAMSQAAAACALSPEATAQLAPLVLEQVAATHRHVDWHLARSRAAAAHGLPGARVAVGPVVAGLVRVLERVHAERGLLMACDAVDPACLFAGEAQDLQEMLGNLLDNACKWAHHEVHVSACNTIGPAGPKAHLVIEDDGPGIDAERRRAVMQRGKRLDESLPGSGLGLAIVDELVGLYGGHMTLGTAASGGLRVDLTLPAPADAAAASSNLSLLRRRNGGN